MVSFAAMKDGKNRSEHLKIPLRYPLKLPLETRFLPHKAPHEPKI